MGKTVRGLIDYCKAQVGRPYWYGAGGQIGTQSLYNALKKQYPNQYTAQDYESQYGNKVHDCGGLIEGYMTSKNANTGQEYQAVYDINSYNLYSMATIKGPISDFQKIEGALLFKSTSTLVTGIHHVGVYSNGYVYEAKSHAAGVCMTTYKKQDWNFWALYAYLIYDEDTCTKLTDETITGIHEYKDYAIGATYRTQVDHLAVRQGPGTEYHKYTFDELKTDNAKEHAYSDGCLRLGTELTVKETGTDIDGNTWIKSPAGWEAAYYYGQYYIN